MNKQNDISHERILHVESVHAKNKKKHTAQETRKRGAERIETKLFLWLVKETDLRLESPLDTCRTVEIYT